MQPSSVPSAPQQNAMTYAGVAVMAVLAAGFVALLGVLTSGVLFVGLLFLACGFPILCLFHYVVWGRLAQSMMVDEEQETPNWWTEP